MRVLKKGFEQLPSVLFEKCKGFPRSSVRVLLVRKCVLVYYVTLSLLRRVCCSNFMNNLVLPLCVVKAYVESEVYYFKSNQSSEIVIFSCEVLFYISLPPHLSLLP